MCVCVCVCVCMCACVFADWCENSSAGAGSLCELQVICVSLCDLHANIVK